MKQQTVNHYAVWILVCIDQAIGVLWYSTFEDVWLHYIGKTASDLGNMSSFPYVLSIISSVVLSYTIAFLFKKLEVDHWLDGVQYAFMFWLAFQFFELLTIGGFEMRPYGLAILDASKSLIVFLLTGAVLGHWLVYKEQKLSFK